MTCPEPSRLAAWLDGEVTANEGQALTAHLGGCDACRSAHRRFLQTATALRELPLPEPDPRLAAEVLAKVRSGRPAWRWRVPALAVGFVACAVVAISLRPEPTFTARGGETAGAEARQRKLGIELFRHPHGGAAPHPLQPEERLAPGDGLSFVAYNRTGQSLHLLIFGLDARAEVHWFYPAYSSSDSDPSSIPLSGAEQVVQLPEGVTLESPAPGAFQLVAAFSPSAVRVSEVEALLAAGGMTRLRDAIKEATFQIHPLWIDPKAR